MKLRCTARRLANAFGAVEGAVRAGGSAAQLQVRDGQVHVAASDGEVSVVTTIQATETEDGEVLVAPHPVASYAATLPPNDPVDLFVEKGRLVLSSAGNPYRFSTTEGRYVPIENASGEMLDAGALPAMLGSVRHAVDGRTGMVKLVGDGSGMAMYATDGYRLARAAGPAASSGTWSVLLPVPWLQLALKVDPDRFCLDQRGRLASFSSRDGSTTVTVRLGASTFPAVESALAVRPPHTCSVSGTSVLAAVQKLSIVASGEPLRCRVEDGQLILQAVSATGEGTETVAASGGSITSFGVSAKNLTDAVSACGDDLELSYGEPNQPIWLEGAGMGTSVTCVVMPTIWQDR